MENENKTKEKSFKKLYQEWKAMFKVGENEYQSEKEYIAPDDTKYLKPGVEISHFYQTRVMPLPFWGNIGNPDYVVLSNNPSCEPIIDELESLFYFKELKDTLTNGSGQSVINWLDDKFDFKEILKQIDTMKLDDDYEKHIEVQLENGRSRKISLNSKQISSIKTLKKHLHFDKKNKKLTLTSFKTTYDWWNEVFDNVEIKEKDKIFEKIGFFNLCGYHSRSYEKIPQKFIDKERLKKEKEQDGKYIPTVAAVIDYVSHLISNKADEIKIILIWGSDWENHIYKGFHMNEEQVPSEEEVKKFIIQLEDDNKLIQVNKNQGRNKRLKSFFNDKTKEKSN